MPLPEPPLPVAVGDLIADKYRIERVLGRGGMGFVVAARHRDLGHLVAIKMLLPHIAERAEIVERFLREGRAAVQLKSEHATRVTDVGLHTSRASAPGAPSAVPFMVMEHLEGSSLGSLLYRGPLPPSHAALYVIQACEALEEAHRLGIVHRDLKPDNLFVSRRPNGAPLVKVLDFGISRVPSGHDERRLTDNTDVMGTPLYMAPEQMESLRNADARSDVWALGVTLYELLTGELPFDGGNVAAICARVLKAQPTPPRALLPTLPAELEAIVLRCLAKEPAQRFQSAAALAAALAPFAHEGGPVTGVPAGGGARSDAVTMPGSPPMSPSAITLDATTHVSRRARPVSFIAAAAGAAIVAACGILVWRLNSPAASAGADLPMPAPVVTDATPAASPSITVSAASSGEPPASASASASATATSVVTSTGAASGSMVAPGSPRSTSTAAVRPKSSSSSSSSELRTIRR